MEVGAISKFATAKMQSFVSLVNYGNYESFTDRDGERTKVILFTERKSTSPLFKSLSKKFKGKINLGEARKSEDLALIKQYGVTKFPTLLAIKEPSSYEHEKYDGDMNFDRISVFLSKHAHAKQVQKVDW
jgi:protein disulfide-isomerase A6